MIEYVKRKANGVCDLCGLNAPFMDKKGKPFLECHHVKWLARKGMDWIDNAVALCPNCHRKMHIVQDKLDIKKLSRIAKHRA